MQLAERRRCPLLIDWDSGGADINEGVASLDIFRRIFTQINELSGRVPMLSVLSGLSAGGGAYAPVMTDAVIMIDGSMMAVTGPQVIRVATGEDVTPDEMGGAQLHSEQSGEAHYRGGDLRGRSVPGAQMVLLPAPEHVVPAAAVRLMEETWRANRLAGHRTAGPTKRASQT